VLDLSNPDIVLLLDRRSIGVREQKEVIRSQSVASMPFLLSCACFCNGLIWTTFGAIKKDIFIYVRNPTPLVAKLVGHACPGKNMAIGHPTKKNYQHFTVLSGFCKK
jgi:hypothetical protein